MKMSNTTRAAISLALLLPMSGIVNATVEREKFEVSVSIPTAEFYVIPPSRRIHRAGVAVQSGIGDVYPLRKNSIEKRQWRHYGAHEYRALSE